MSNRGWSEQESSALVDHLVAAHRQYGKFEPFWHSIASSFRSHHSAEEIRSFYHSNLKQEVEKRLTSGEKIDSDPEDEIYLQPITLVPEQTDEASSALPFRELYQIDPVESHLGTTWIPLLVSRDSSVGWAKPPNTFIDDLPRGNHLSGIYELAFISNGGDQEKMIAVYLGITEDMRSTLSSIRRSGGPLNPLLKPYLDLKAVLHARWRIFEGEDAHSDAKRTKQALEQQVDYAFNSSSADCPRRYPFYQKDVLYLNHLLTRISGDVNESVISATNCLSEQQLDDLIALLSYQRLQPARLLDVEE